MDRTPPGELICSDMRQNELFRDVIRPAVELSVLHAAPFSAVVISMLAVIAKFHYTDPTRTRPDPHGPARTFFAVKLRWVRAGPVGSV